MELCGDVLGKCKMKESNKKKDLKIHTKKAECVEPPQMRDAYSSEEWTKP